MTNLSESGASALLDDRVSFKLYAAEQELNSIRELEENGLGLSSPSFVARVDTKIRYNRICIVCCLSNL